MQKNDHQLLEDHLKILVKLKEVEADDFFYTRLKANMERSLEKTGWVFFLRPSVMIGSLCLVLLVNGIFLQQKFKKTNINSNTTDIQIFAYSYDQFNLPSY
jgi:TRAP-type mannitol/chloroaromatic compound transport system permease small subunit